MKSLAASLVAGLAAAICCTSPAWCQRPAGDPPHAAEQGNDEGLGGAAGQGGFLPEFHRHRPHHDPFFHRWHGPHYPPYYYYPRPLYYGPIFVPPELMFGPQAIRRYLGIDTIRPPVAPNIIILDKDGKDQAEDKGELRGTNQRAVELGWKFIGYGDAHFAGQRYGEAYQRYKTASQVAPQLAAAYFRQAYACIARGNYDLAVKAVQRGLELDPDWPRSDFRSDELYGNNRLAKSAHLDALAQAATDDPNNADLMFLVGLRLFFDGQRDRAPLFFQRAAAMGGGDQARVTAFLDVLEQADNQPEGNPG
jgi:tetratricopeptide (TPR) repeat protein